jgi:hypothetical protein
MIAWALHHAPWAAAVRLIVTLLIRRVCKLVGLKSRRWNCVAFLKAAPPGTLLVDRTGHRNELIMFRMHADDMAVVATAVVRRHR